MAALHKQLVHLRVISRKTRAPNPRSRGCSMRRHHQMRPMPLEGKTQLPMPVPLTFTLNLQHPLTKRKGHQQQSAKDLNAEVLH